MASSSSNKVSSPYFAGHKPGKSANMDPNQYRNFCSVRQNVWSVGPSEPVVGAILAEVVGVAAASFVEAVGVAAAASFAEVVEAVGVAAAGFAEVAGAVEEAALVAGSLVEVLAFAQRLMACEPVPRVGAGMPNVHQPEMK